MSLHVSSAPHVHSKDSTQTIMRDVLIAMLPTTVMGVYAFGFNAALLCVLGVVAAVLAEYGYQKLTRQRVRIGDLSAAVTGLLVALNLPGNAPWWMPVVGSFIAIVLVKQLFGGIGDNFMNPALTARGIMLASWPVRMTAWYLPTFCKGVDAVSSATVLGGYEASTYDMFMGFIPGTIGEVSKIAILIGFIYLLIRKVISWRIPVVQDVLTSVLSGGLLFGAVFMATDYTTSPMTEVGQYIYAFGCGLILAVIRKWGSYTEGVTYAILIMNVATPLIDKFVKIRVYGQEKPKKEVKANV
ncbi:MAG: hypothetical protein BHV94_04725 [Clostridiales bacterium 59_14]|nr:MAG: hypothetical protein BHV94_04725 [Clostridiales bacterium 59_14]